MKNIKKIAGVALVSTIIAASSSAIATSDSSEEYVVIVNSSNSISGSDVAVKNQIKNLFLKQKLQWSNGKSSVPFLLPEKSETFQQFLSSILEMTPQQYEKHWIRLKQLSGNTPPREVLSERLLARMVGRFDGAVGIVKKSTLEKTGVGKNVKPVLTFK